MRRTGSAVAPAALALVLALAGCGGSGTTSTKASIEKKLRPTTKVVAVAFTSPAVRDGRLSALYTCDGKDVSPPLKWGSVPSNLHELALFATTAATGGSSKAAKTIDWAITGIAPSLRGLAAGEVPRGAFLIENSDGRKRYHVCPAKGQTERYEFALYALPELIRAGPQVSGALLLHNLTGHILQGRAPVEGTFTATYTRG